MAEPGFAALPDLDAPFRVPGYILDALEKVPNARHNFDKLPSLYVRVRVGYIDETWLKPEDRAKRLSNFVKKTSQGKLYGNWNDGGRLA